MITAFLQFYLQKPFTDSTKCHQLLAFCEQVAHLPIAKEVIKALESFYFAKAKGSDEK